MILALVPAALAGHMVIVDGSTDADQAAAMFAAWSGPTATGWPQLVASDEVPGLKPGFHILTFGVFETAAQARAWSSYLNALGGQTYVREVDLPATDAFLEVETSLSVTFSDGTARLPLTQVASRSCQTQAPIGTSPVLADGTATVIAPAGVDVCVGPEWDQRFVAEHQLTACSGGANVTCVSALPKPGRDYRAILIRGAGPGEETSEDWAFFTDDVQRLAGEAGLPIEWTFGRVAPVRVDGRTVARIPLGATETVGYWFVASGKAPAFQPHAPPEVIWAAAEAYFGL